MLRQKASPLPRRLRPQNQPNPASRQRKHPTGEKAPEAEPPSTVRAKTPALRGLKVMGKIEIKKPDSNSSGERRKRKRKKITTGPSGGNRGGGNRGRTGGSGGGSKRREEPKEVSSKDIEDKIKATMAPPPGRRR